MRTVLYGDLLHSKKYIRKRDAISPSPEREKLAHPPAIDVVHSASNEPGLITK